MDALFTTDNLIALATLTALEVVLGVDNVIFISILAGKLPASQQARARRVGLMAAMVMRILLLFSLAWIVRLTAPLFSVLGRGISGFIGHTQPRRIAARSVAERICDELGVKLGGAIGFGVEAPGQHVVDGHRLALGGRQR